MSTSQLWLHHGDKQSHDDDDDNYDERPDRDDLRLCVYNNINLDSK